MNGTRDNSLSVIVAVYNTEKYLKKCLDSIVQQQYPVDELILVDDGSTDRSGIICDEYAKKHAFIKVFHQENQGQTAAQKQGMDYATGKYVSFVDSDDWIDKDYFSVLMGEMLEHRVDAVITNMFLLEEENNFKVWDSILACGLYDEKGIQNKIIPYIVHNELKAKDTVLPFMPGKIFELKKLKKTSRNIDLRIKLGQDGAITFPYILDCKSLQVISCCGYHYIQRSGSVSQAPRFTYFEELKILQEYLFEEMSKRNIGETGRSQTNIYLRDLLIIAIRKIYGVEMGRILCVPPYEMIEKDSRLVIYGAGLAGQSYVKQILHSNYARIAGWVDKNSTETLYGIQIQHPECIMSMDFDYILIAITERNIVEKVKQYIMQMDIPEEKITWKEIYWG